MPKIFIDTDKFEGLYWSHEDLSKIIDDYKKFEPYLVLTEQQIDEFIRNRDKQLDLLIGQIDSTKFVETLSSISIVRKFPKFKEIKKFQDNIKKLKVDLIKEFQKLRDHPSEDLIFQFFMGLVDNRNIPKIKRTEKIIQKAYSRKLVGNPPTSKEKSSIGDEINWESLLSYIDDDLIIISRDKTFIEHKTFLIREFQSVKDKKNLGIFSDISEVFPLIEKKPSKELIKFEKEVKYTPQLTNFNMMAGAMEMAQLDALRAINKMESDRITELIGKINVPNFDALQAINKMQSDRITELLKISVPNFDALQAINKMQSDRITELLKKINLPDFDKIKESHKSIKTVSVSKINNSKDKRESESEFKDEKKK